MPVAYQSRAVTEPQREVARRSRDGGIDGTSYGDSFISPSASWSLLQKPCLHAYPARAYFCPCKSRQNTVKGDRTSPLTNPFDA